MDVIASRGRNEIQAMNNGDQLLLFLVEGEERSTSSISGRLEAAGFTVRAFRGWAALQEVPERSPVMIILDFPLPDADEVDLLRRLADLDALRSARKVVLSTNSSEKNKVETLDAGADDYITKPFSVRELIARI